MGGVAVALTPIHHPFITGPQGHMKADHSDQSHPSTNPLLFPKSGPKIKTRFLQQLFISQLCCFGAACQPVIRWYSESALRGSAHLSQRDLRGRKTGRCVRRNFQRFFGKLCRKACLVYRAALRRPGRWPDRRVKEAPRAGVCVLGKHPGQRGGNLS